VSETAFLLEELKECLSVTTRESVQSATDEAHVVPGEGTQSEEDREGVNADSSGTGRFESEHHLQQTPHGAASDSEGTQALMALHQIDPFEQAVINTDGDESQYLLETGEPVTVPLDYQSLIPDQVTELQELLHKFPELTSDKLGRTDVLEHDVNVGDAPPIRQQPYRVPLAMRHTMERELDKMLQLYRSKKKVVNFRRGDECHKDVTRMSQQSKPT